MNLVENGDPEAQLMLRFQGGDDVAFEALYRSVRDATYRFALRMLGEPQVASEAAQDILVKVYRARSRYTPTARFRTWLFRIATNHCLNERRRAWRRFEVASEEGTAGLNAPAPMSANPAAVHARTELAHALQHALGELPPRQRAAVVLARFEGCTMAEIAQILDITEGATKALLNRARVTLTGALTPWLAAQEVG